jgi:hypothetical protein
MELQIISSIVKDVCSVAEEKMRMRVLGVRLRELNPGEVAFFIEHLYKSCGAAPGARKVQELMVDPENMKKVIGEEKCRQTYHTAIDMELKRASRLLTDLPPHKKGIYGYTKEEEAKMEFVSLGQRRALAKTQTKDTLDRLLSDPDPIVIANLLTNPRITEHDILKIASKRPNSPKILKLLATHRKWSRRYLVIKAIVLNPYSPPRVSMVLLEFLMNQDVESVASDGSIHPQVRMGAEELLEEKRAAETNASDKDLTVQD